MNSIEREYIPKSIRNAEISKWKIIVERTTHDHEETCISNE